jgi:hypothetical protein
MFSAALLDIFHLQAVEQSVEALEVSFQDSPIAFQPCGCFGQGLSLDLAGTALSVAATRDQPGPFQYFEMFGNCRLAHGEGLGQLRDRSFASRQPRENGPPCGIGESREGSVEAVGGCLSITHRLHNR